MVTLQINTPAGTTANGNGTGAVMIDWMIVRNSTTGTEPTATVNSEEGLYVTTNPSILPNNPVSFTSLSDFTEISVKNGGEIKYQISNDGGVTWYWYNSGWIATSSGYTESNIASEVGSNIASFSTGDGSFVFKAYLNSNGTQLVKLSNIELSYINDITGPARSSTSPSGALSSGTTSTNISLTTDENAICKYSTTPGTSYGFMPQTFGTTGGVNHSQSISSLTNGSSHVYYVRCQDSIGNSNSDDLLISFSVVEITRSESTSSGSRPNNFNLLNKNIPLENENKAIVIFKKEFGFGSRGEEVIELQNFLIKNSYLLKSLNTGFFGNLTKNALTDFQKQNNIFPATGFFGPKTKAIINSKNNSETSSGNYGTNDNFIKPMDTLLRDLKIGMIGEDVRMLQKLLNQNGYFVSNFGAGSNGQETNYFGPKTQKALKDYQSKNNIFPTAGYFGPITRQNMKFKTLKGLWW